MVLLSTITSKFNRIIAPKLLKNSLLARYFLSKNKPIIVDNPYIDSFFLLPLAQKLISIEVQNIAKEKEEEAEEKKRKERQRKEKTGKGNNVKQSVDDYIDAIWDKYLEPMAPKSKTLQDDDSASNSDPPRLKAFMEYIRPALTPNNLFQDLNRWRFHNRFVKWLRSEYLICKYESEIRTILSSYPKLKHSALLTQARSRLRNAMKFGLSVDLFDSADDYNNIANGKSNSHRIRYAKSLPTVNLLNDAFQMHHWNKTKSTVDEYKKLEYLTTEVLNGNVYTIPGTNVQISDVDNDKNLQSLTLEEILELAGCHVSSCNAFNALCDDAGIYEFWTEDYVHQLSNYLTERCQQLSHGADTKDVVIVDVGAGDGTLVKFLRENMITRRKMGSPIHNNSNRKRKNEKNKKNPGNKNTGKSKQKAGPIIPSIIATDDGSWSIEPKANVEKLSVTETMHKYNPYKDSKDEISKKHHLIVLCSWMPMGEDWTKIFRDAGVDEYILIGECDDGNCGHNWYTWGNAEFFEGNDEDDIHSYSKVMPDYSLDGYQRNELEHLSNLQFSRFDSIVSSGSKTISFQRIKSL